MVFVSTRSRPSNLWLILGLFCSSCTYITYQNAWVHYSSPMHFTDSAQVASKHAQEGEETWLNFSRLETLNERELTGIKPLTILFYRYEGNNASFTSMEEATEAAKTCWGPFKSLKEPKPACVFTEDITTLDTADALVYHGIVDTRKTRGLSPKKRKWDQIRIFYSRESPYRKIKKLSEIPKAPQLLELPNDVNWTFTYRTDSDIPGKYGSFQLLPTKNNSESPSTATATASKSKSKLIAWIVSHCKTLNQRELIVKKLGEFLPVDIYGQCGPFKCAIERKNSSWSNCYQELGSHYKFFLAFENNMCEDYVTDKMYLPLQNNMVPIVYGGADYAKFAPPHSYINVLDFPSLKELANYIKFLDRNPAEYDKYFLWRKKYQVEYYSAGSFCSLCEKLWKLVQINFLAINGVGVGQRRIDPSYRKTYENLLSFYLHSHSNNYGGKSKSGDSERTFDASKKRACWLPPPHLFQ